MNGCQSLQRTSAIIFSSVFSLQLILPFPSFQEALLVPVASAQAVTCDTSVTPSTITLKKGDTKVGFNMSVNVTGDDYVSQRFFAANGNRSFILWDEIAPGDAGFLAYCNVETGCVPSANNVPMIYEIYPRQCPKPGTYHITFNPYYLTADRKGVQCSTVKVALIVPDLCQEPENANQNTPPPLNKNQNMPVQNRNTNRSTPPATIPPTVSGITTLPSSDDKFSYHTAAPIAADTNVSDITNTVARSLFTWLSIIAIPFIIVSGLQFAKSMGDELAIAQAKRNLMYSVVGLLIGILGQLIITIVTSFFS